MEKDPKKKKVSAIKRFFSQFVEKVDKRMEEKSKSSGCCCGGPKSGNKSCCS